jgi:hypothetical protein
MVGVQGQSGDLDRDRLAGFLALGVELVVRLLRVGLVRPFSST